MKTILISEWKTMTRQRSYYTFFILWVLVFSLLFLLEKTNSGISGFTNITGTILNIILYLLPLFMLITGSFSIANEMENGQWQLLSTYPVSLLAYLLGKCGGLFTAQTVIFTLSFGCSMGIGLIAGNAMTLGWLLKIYLFSILLIYTFIILGLLIGTWVKTRWQAFTISVAMWFFLIMIWPTALITFLGLVPYPVIEPIMKMAMMLNPAEFLRIFFIVKWDSGSVFGQSYDSIVTLFHSGAGWLILSAYLAIYLVAFISLALLCLQRRRQ
ncbi:ABC transporter permease [Bacillus sp. JJ1764]|uniref:ABC transporter permease n=1 Tax=Bacillus sp. JJ1764 TaxID=3122964 RepID=UPI002FFE1BB7